MISRRAVVMAGVAALAPAARAEVRVKPGKGSDQTRLLQNAINAASDQGKELVIEGGRYRVSSLRLSKPISIRGAGGLTLIEARTSDPVFFIADAGKVSLTGLGLNGGTGIDGLIYAARVKSLYIDTCTIVGGKRGLLLDTCGGRVLHCDISGQADSGLFSIDATGMDISGNSVSNIGNNGIQVWRSAFGEDATIISNNRVFNIRKSDGGTGQNGNGISVFRAGNVIVSNNRVSDCAFSAIRSNSGSNIQMLGNSVSRCEEVALYSEFEFRGAVIANNTVEDSAYGISIANYDVDGRLAVCSGNVIRKIRPGQALPNSFVGGIHCEADTIISNNVIEDVRDFGIRLGWGKCRNLTAEGNIIRKTRHGIEVSAAEGAESVSVQGNLIAADLGIVAMDHQNPVSGDLLLDGTATPLHLSLSGNRRTS